MGIKGIGWESLAEDRGRRLTVGVPQMLEIS